MTPAFSAPVRSRRTIAAVFFEVAARRIDPTLNPRFGRFGLVTLTGFVAAGLAIELPGRAPSALVGAVLAVAAAVPLFLWRPRFPVGVATASTIGIVLLANGQPGSLAWFGVCVLAGWCALGADTVVGVAFWIASSMLLGAQWLLTVHDPGWGAWIGGVSFTVLAALLIRHQMALVEQMRALQDDLAQRTRLDERARIARDLHDVIAHSLTVSLLHVSSARLAVEHEPEVAAQALADAERLTRQSLADVRVTVGLLRTPDDDGIATPAPGVGDLPRLVDELRAAWADISLVVEGDLDELPATVGATAYRIVQESLTNAARHAPGSTVTVHLEARNGRVGVSVASSGPPGRGSGMGLTNMRERAEAVGGSLYAGPEELGWLVHASLPGTAPHGGAGS